MVHTIWLNNGMESQRNFVFKHRKAVCCIEKQNNVILLCGMYKIEKNKQNYIYTKL